jgi:hypothetical protein
METLIYHSVDQLRELKLAELQALWELVPTDRQRAYKIAYEREIRTAGAVGSDELEHQVALELLRRYDEAALVPVGSRWARTPGRVQTAAKDNLLLDAPENDRKPASGKLSPRMMMGVAIVALLLIGFLFTRLLGGSGNNVAVEITPEATPSPTPELSPTPTPLALEAPDAIIQGGDTGREVAYPVNLQIMLPPASDNLPPRVWVVQRRRVQASEWNFDANPDTASFIAGMAVQPVIGIPWSEENAAFFATIGAGTHFRLTLNTGAVLEFEFAEKRAVRRSETTIFRQVSPGLAVLLIGETDEDGLPTATRPLITAVYPPEQELSRLGSPFGATSIQTGKLGDVLRLGDATFMLRDMQFIDDSSNVPPDMHYLLLDVEVTAGDMPLDTASLRLELVDASGQLFMPNAAALSHGNFAALPAEIPAFSSLSASIGYVVPKTLSGGRWLVTDMSGSSIAFELPFAPASTAENFGAVDVRLVSVTTQPGQLVTHLRIYNGRPETLHFTQDTIWLALGYAPEPPGPRNPAEGLTPFDLLPEQAVDLTLVWYWNGEPYASLGVGEYRFAIQLTR